MRFSLFTPTHRSTHLLALFHSLLDQTFTDWEWILVPNGTDMVVPNAVLADRRVRVIPAPLWLSTNSIGALKGFACGHCLGDYLVEVDHDDLLAPQALERIDEAARRTGAGFLYWLVRGIRG